MLLGLASWTWDEKAALGLHLKPTHLALNCHPSSARWQQTQSQLAHHTSIRPYHTSVCVPNRRPVPAVGYCMCNYHNLAELINIITSTCCGMPSSEATSRLAVRHMRPPCDGCSSRSSRCHPKAHPTSAGRWITLLTRDQSLFCSHTLLLHACGPGAAHNASQVSRHADELPVRWHVLGVDSRT